MFSVRLLHTVDYESLAEKQIIESLVEKNFAWKVKELNS